MKEPHEPIFCGSLPGIIVILHMCGCPNYDPFMGTNRDP